MYARDVMASLRRRWLLAIVAIGLATGAALFAASAIAPTYEAKSSLVLVPPETTTGHSGNPYLFLGGLQQSVDVLTRALTADTQRELVAKQAPTGMYDVVADLATSAPILLVSAKAPTSAAAQALLEEVKSQVPVTLRELQDSLGVRTGAQITSMVVTNDEPVAIQKARYRSVVLVGVATLAVGLLLIAVLDGALEQRRAKRAERDETQDDAEDEHDHLVDLHQLDPLANLERQMQQSPSLTRKRR